MATATNSRELFVQGMCVVRGRGSKIVTLAISLMDVGSDANTLRAAIEALVHPELH